MIFNHIRLESILARADDYIVDGKSVIEWIKELYAFTTHKESGIRYDPNAWPLEVGNPRHILDLLLSVIEVSLRNVEIVDGLPGVTFD